MTAPPRTGLFTTRPRPAVPLSLVVSSALLIALTGAALAQRSPGLAAYLVVAAIVPWAPRERLRWIGVLLAHAGVVLCLFEIVRVPMGSRVTAVLIPAALALAARAWALGTEGALRWSHPRWSAGITASVQPPDEAISLAFPPALAPTPTRDATLATPATTATSATPARGRPSLAVIDAAVVALAAASPAAIPEDEADRRAFWINAYNVFAAHAGRGRRSPRLLDALEVARTAYEVAGLRFTLDEIEHGMLRGGAASPIVPWSRVSAGDPRMRWAVRLDPRIHFALSRGTLGSPPPRTYQGVDLDAQLEQAAAAFLAAESAIDDARGTLETTRLLAWYARDFGGQRGVRAVLARALGLDEARVAGLRLKFRSYDWTSAL